MENKIVLIGGGSASGKTYLSALIKNHYKDEVEIIAMDNYCIPHESLSLDERSKQNYDHPSSYDGNLLKEHLEIIINKGSFNIPVYDFSKHLRSKQTKEIKAKKIIIIDGIYALYYKPLLDIAYLKIYLECDENIRLERRINRDVKERGRTKQSVIEQFYNTVKPMHDLYVSKTKQNADFIYKNNENNGFKQEIIDEIISYIDR